MFVVVVMGFVECGPRRDGVRRCVRGHMSLMRALYCGGHGGDFRGPADRGVFLRKVVATRWSGRRGRVLCRRLAWGSGYVGLFGWLSVVQCEAAVTRLWGY